MTDIIKIDPKEYGLTDQTAKTIRMQFEPMLQKMEELETEFNSVVNLPIGEKKTSEKAKELRLKYVKVRTGTAEIHKLQKAFYLNGGRFVDGWKNAQIFASEGKEKKLEEIEKYLENLEKARIEKLNEERTALILPYINPEDVIPYGVMQADVWDAYFNAKVKAFNDRIEAEKKAEADRIEREKAIALHNERKEKILPFWDFVPAKNKDMDFSRFTESEWKERFNFSVKEKQNYDIEQARIKAENEKLKAEAEGKEKLLLKERKQREAEAEKLKAKADAEKKAYELKIKKETDAKNKLLAEAKAKADAEKKAQEDILKEKLKLEKLSINKRLAVWIDGFVLPETSVNNETTKLIKEKFESFKKWAKIEIQK